MVQLCRMVKGDGTVNNEENSSPEEPNKPEPENPGDVIELGESMSEPENPGEPLEKGRE